jgi:hypothetical protein
VAAAMAWPAAMVSPGNAIQLAFALFNDDENGIGHKFSF